MQLKLACKATAEGLLERGVGAHVQIAIDLHYIPKSCPLCKVSMIKF
jgi:hypothetical protein